MKKIDSSTYHHAMALYMIARRKQAEVDELEREANALLNEENGSLLSDEIYTCGNLGTKEEYDLALKRMKIVVDETTEVGKGK